MRLAVRFADGKIRSVRKAGLKQENYLIDVINKTLAYGGASLTDVGQVCVARGPGRFTGIRIGLTFASVLKAISGSEVCAATVFEMLVHEMRKNAACKKWLAANEGGLIACVIHAFREEYFCQLFDARGVAVAAPCWLEKGRLGEYLTSFKKPLYCCGWGEKHTPLSVIPAGYEVNLKVVAVQAKTLFEAAAPCHAPVVEPLYLKPAKFELPAK